MTMPLAADVLCGSISTTLAGFVGGSPLGRMRLAKRVCLDRALLRTLLVMMRAKDRGLWEIAANVGLTGKRPRETSLDSQATLLLRANEVTQRSGRTEARIGLRMMPTFPRSSLSFRLGLSSVLNAFRHH
jgi:hypothetical protein